MTKKVISIILFIFYFSFSFSQQKDTIYGKVKSVSEYLYCNENDLMKPNNEIGGSDTSTFNLLKYLQNVWINKPTHTSLKYFKEFNKKGNVSQEIWIDRFKDTTFLEYKYDKYSNLIQKKKTHWDGETTTRNFKYIKNKIRSYIYYESEDPTSFFYSEHIYDSILNLTRIKRFDEFGQTESYIYAYDNSGNKIKEIVHRPFVYIKNGETTKGKKDSIGLYKLSKTNIYDDKNQLIETLNYDAYSFDN